MIYAARFGGPHFFRPHQLDGKDNLTAQREARILGLQVIPLGKTPGLACDTKLLAIGDMDFNLVVLLEASASTTTAGSRMARLFAHFATRMASVPMKAPHPVTPRTACCTSP